MENGNAVGMIGKMTFSGQRPSLLFKGRPFFTLNGGKEGFFGKIRKDRRKGEKKIICLNH
jgi:hypothetical protein